MQYNHLPQKPPYLYGWLLLGLCVSNIIISSGIVNSFSVVFVTLISEFGLKRGELSGIFSLYIFVLFCGGALIGPLLDKIGPRIIIPIGSFLIGFGLLASSRISSLYQLYFFYGFIVSLGACCISWLPNSIIVTNWFRNRAGMAMGILMCGNGIGALIFIPLTQFMIERIEWRATFLTMAVITVLWVAPLNAIFQRARPEDKGFISNGDGSELFPIVPSDYKAVTSTLRKFSTLSAVLHQQSFWMMCFANFFNPLATFAIALHQVAFIVGQGYDPMYVASRLGLIGVFTIIGRIVGGALSDRIGRELAYSIFMGYGILAVIFLFFLTPENSWILPLYVVLMGLGMGVGGGMFPPMIADLFPGTSLGRLLGITSTFSGVGAGFGSWFTGYLYDLTGSYKWGLLSVITALIAAVVFVWIAAPRKARKVLISRTVT